MTQASQAEEELPSDALEFGTDANGRTHAYSRIEHTVFVDDSDVDGYDAYDLHGTPFNSPGDWADMVDGTCGWDELRLTNKGAIDELANKVNRGVDSHPGI